MFVLQVYRYKALAQEDSSDTFQQCIDKAKLCVASGTAHPESIQVIDTDEHKEPVFMEYIEHELMDCYNFSPREIEESRLLHLPTDVLNSLPPVR